jgi:hypothetical protein
LEDKDIPATHCRGHCSKRSSTEVTAAEVGRAGGTRTKPTGAQGLILIPCAWPVRSGPGGRLFVGLSPVGRPCRPPRRGTAAGRAVLPETNQRNIDPDPDRTGQALGIRISHRGPTPASMYKTGGHSLPPSLRQLACTTHGQTIMAQSDVARERASHRAERQYEAKRKGISPYTPYMTQTFTSQYSFRCTMDRIQ